MEYIFYILCVAAIFFTLEIIFHRNPIYIQIYLVILLSIISIIFFMLGAYFIGALEIIIYAGAITVLFIFTVMILNLNKSSINEEENRKLKSKTFIATIILFTIMLVLSIYYILDSDVDFKNTCTVPVTVKTIGTTLFGPYILAVELISMILISGLIAVLHIGNKNYFKSEKIVNINANNDLNKSTIINTDELI